MRQSIEGKKGCGGKGSRGVKTKAKAKNKSKAKAKSKSKCKYKAKVKAKAKSKANARAVDKGREEIIEGGGIGMKKDGENKSFDGVSYKAEEKIQLGGWQG